MFFWQCGSSESFEEWNFVPILCLKIMFEDYNRSMNAYFLTWVSNKKYASTIIYRTQNWNMFFWTNRVVGTLPSYCFTKMWDPRRVFFKLWRRSPTSLKKTWRQSPIFVKKYDGNDPIWRQSPRPTLVHFLPSPLSQELITPVLTPPPGMGKWNNKWIHEGFGSEWFKTLELWPLKVKLRMKWREL